MRSGHGAADGFGIPDIADRIFQVESGQVGARARGPHQRPHAMSGRDQLFRHGRSDESARAGY
jgi:hypothetical protein